MALLNFSRPSFVKAILADTKHRTVRPRRKHPIRKGEKLYLYTGLRTPAAKKLREVTCTGVQEVVLVQQASTGSSAFPLRIYLDGKLLNRKALLQFVHSIGFVSPAECYAYFQSHYTFPFRGQVIDWQ